MLSRLKELDLYRRWLASDDYRKLIQTRDQIESLLDAASLGQLVQDMFGESVVVAVYPAGDGEPAGVLLTQAAGTDVLARTISRWNMAERAEITPVAHAGSEYVRRVAPASADAASADAKTQFYTTLGRVFVLSDSEAAVQRAVELAGKENLAESLAAEPLYQAARDSLAPGTVASAWANPRMWEAPADVAESDAPGDAGPSSVAGLARNVESVIVGVRLEHGLVLEAVVRLEAGTSHDAWSEFVEQSAGAAEFLLDVPGDALIVLAGRTNFLRTERLLSSQLPEGNRRQWELVKQLSPLLAIDIVNDVFPVLGENWVLYIVGREEPQAQAPVDAVFAFELAGRVPPAGRPAGWDRLERGLATAWDRLARFLSQGGTQADVTVETETLERTTIRWVAGLGDYAPTCALSEDALILASSPNAARSWLQLPPEQRLRRREAFSEWHQRYLAGRNPALFLNIGAARQFVRAHRELLVRRAADEGRMTAEAAAERLERFDDLLNLIDAAFAAVELGERHVRIVVGGLVEMQQP
jgi:hypothetical protein